MATQGLVTVRKRGKVRMKIVVGTDGMKAPEVAAAIRKLDRVPSLHEAYSLATELHFGTEEDLVVINETGILHRGHGEAPSPWYRKTFRRPEFNPRWKHGTADHIEVIDLD